MTFRRSLLKVPFPTAELGVKAVDGITQAWGNAEHTLPQRFALLGDFFINVQCREREELKAWTSSVLECIINDIFREFLLFIGEI